MDAKKLLYLSSLLPLLFLPGHPLGTGLAAEVGGRENLDLPFSVGISAEDEEAAPEFLIFFGQLYEADAVIFTLDKSGSMSSQNRWLIQSQEVIRSINELSERAQFGIVYYGSRVEPMRKVPIDGTAAGKSAAAAFVKSHRPQGDTCLFEGLTEALRIVQRSKSERRTVIVTSDGKPDVCATGDLATPQQISSLIAQSVAMNPGLKIKVHTIWVGASNNGQAINFMRRLATAHGGTFRTIGH